jgi:3-oxoacyl-[acyl-carrier protein] reductase
MPKRRVLVSGASRGIGREVVDRLIAEGHEPIGLARNKPSDYPGQFHAVDLGDRAATAATLDTIVAEGRVDAVVNNVGFARFGHIGSIDLDDLFLAYDMNVRTAVQVVQAVLPGMVEAGWGRIVSTGITVNAVAPGPIETEMYRELSPVGSEREARVLKGIPLNRVGTPAEIAHVICMLLHEDAGYMTGQIVRVDGGGSIGAT